MEITLDPLYIALWLLGGITHLLWTLLEETRATGQRVTLSAYRANNPYKLESGLALSLLAYVLAASLGQMNEATAIACGYMGDSMAKKFFNSLQARA